MRIIALITLIFAFKCYAAEYPACDIHDSRSVPLYTNGVKATIEASIKGAPCYKAQLEIKVLVSGKPSYSYKAPFNSHVAINWAALTEQDAKNYLESIYLAYNFINCNELLPAKLEEGDPSGYNYNSLLVPLETYNHFKASNCKVFIHQIHYEASRAIVFPVGTKRSLKVSEFGL